MQSYSVNIVIHNHIGMLDFAYIIICSASNMAVRSRYGVYFVSSMSHVCSVVITLFEVLWLMHVADLRRPPMKSIDYLLRAVTRWQRVSNHCLPAIFHSLLTTDNIHCYMSLVYKGYSAWDGSFGNIMNVTKHLSSTDGDAAHPCAV